MVEYDRLPVILQRYSFDEKMRVLQYYSKQVMTINGVNLTAGIPLPWELETFLLFAIKANEYNNNNFIGKNINKFIDMINCIKDHQHPTLFEKGTSIEFADSTMIALGSTQFDIQSFIFYKYYRYNYFFSFTSNEIDMSEEFIKKFGIDYNCFLKLGVTLNFLFSLKIDLNHEILKYAILKYPKATKQLILSRKEFQEKIDEFSGNNTDNYLYCVRPSNIYPFIENNRIVNIPLPHCITRAITDSLLYRLTDNNSKLRTSFGKNVLEKYLFDIIDESNLFDEVLSEKEYKTKNGNAKTSDVMCRKDDNYLFFECKSSVPYAKTRCFDNNSLKNEIDKISDDVIQLYKQIRYEFNASYNFFTTDTKLDYNNCFGLVVLLEESYISKRLIYEKVAEKLNIKIGCEIYIWIINHIKICNLYDIEKYAFTGTDILESLKKQSTVGNPYDFSLSGFKLKTLIENKKLYAFKHNLADNVKEFIDELKEHKLLRNK